MKKPKKKVRVTKNPERMMRKIDKNAKEAQKSYDLLQLCKQIIEFHKAYLAIQMDSEKVNLEELQAKLDALLQPELEEVETTVEEETKTI